MVAGKITVVQMLPDLHSGGVERGTLELGSYLSQRGHRSIVISNGGRLVPRLEQEGSSHLCWPVGKKSPATFKYLLPLRKFLLEQKVDILHLRSRVPAWLGYLAWLSIPPAKRPTLITTFHGFYSINKYSAIMTKGERVIAISRTIAQHIKENYHIQAEKIVTIHRGVDIDAFDPAKVSEERLTILQKQWRISGNPTPIIMLPGRISPWKGHDILIQALAELKDLAWTAVFIGDPAGNPRLTDNLKEMLQKYHLTRRVKFVGHCDDMPAAYLLADLVVSAASTEPEAFGRVSVEAAAMGKPVIASAHGGSLETVLPGKTGWLVKPNNAHSLAKALAPAIVDHDLRRKLGRQGQDWVRNNFTVAGMCAKTLTLYEELLLKRKVNSE
ncbi:MAG: glycosyltransferase family 4 protein [Proteobacteria bacterium]|nr:glycosyltransferase family 4 protein [Pseudomonadota bacterium]MBU1714462.1 glycosyltransferase family 4 protein [Pseudomonadota bacterium]